MSFFNVSNSSIPTSTQPFSNTTFYTTSRLNTTISDNIINSQDGSGGDTNGLENFFKFLEDHPAGTTGVSTTLFFIILFLIVICCCKNKLKQQSQDQNSQSGVDRNRNRYDSLPTFNMDDHDLEMPKRIKEGGNTEEKEALFSSENKINTAVPDSDDDFSISSLKVTPMGLEVQKEDKDDAPDALNADEIIEDLSKADDLPKSPKQEKVEENVTLS